MKNISLLLNLLLIGIIIFLLIHKCDKKDDKDKNRSQYCADADCASFNAGNMEGLVDYNTALLLANNYSRDEGKKFIYDGTVKTDSLDARNIWFDLLKIKNFITYIEKQACKAQCDTSIRLGLRIYYAKYPDAATMSTNKFLNTVDKRFANHHTVFITPTFRDPVTGKNVDFNPQIINSNCKLTPIVKLAYAAQMNNSKAHINQQKDTSSKNNFVYVPLMLNSTSSSSGDQQNHGDLAPPPYNAGSFPTTAD